MYDNCLTRGANDEFIISGIPFLSTNQAEIALAKIIKKKCQAPKTWGMARRAKNLSAWLLNKMKIKEEFGL